MKNIRLLFLLVFFELLFNICFSQEEKKTDVLNANSNFNIGKYELALEEYLLLLVNDSTNDKYLYNIAVCYLNTNIDKTKAIPYLESLKRKPKCDPNVIYLLGRAYHYAYRFEEAIIAYSNFKYLGKGKASNLADVDRQIQYCMNAKELMKYPVDLKFENLGANINSPYADYYPFVPIDESFLVYNTRRTDEALEEQNEDGAQSTSIYISKVIDGEFVKAKNIGPPIAKKDGKQEVIGLSANGEIMLLYYVNNKGLGDIYSTKTDKHKSFRPAEKLNVTVNSRKAEEIAACISPDGLILYFASNREGGVGGTDLYFSHKLPSGKWGTAQNMGPAINSIFDEDFPNISSDGKILYFSSNGHTSMGGFDIFKAELNSETGQYSKSVNIGYPINTPEDNYNFRISNNGRYGYISALREGGYGDLDIYRVTLNGVEPKYSVINGTVSAADSTKKLNFSDVFIQVRDLKTQAEIGNYLLNPTTGRYIIILPPGDYEMYIQAEGFESFSESITVLDKSSYRFEISEDIQLTRIKAHK